VATISEYFNLGKSQSELDFVNVHTDDDICLFIDPYVLSQRNDRFSLECHNTLCIYFENLIEQIKQNNRSEAMRLLSNLHEPRETRLGFSKKGNRGSGIGGIKAEELYRALSTSSAVKTGFIDSLQECELMVEDVSRDKISDLTTNVIRKHLAEYTKEQCNLWNIPVQSTALPPFYNPDENEWESDFFDLPRVNSRALLLVPKAIVRYHPAFDHTQYYQNIVLEYLQTTEISAASSLVKTLKNKKKRVTKKDLKVKYPLSKEYLYKITNEHPELLERYKELLLLKDKMHNVEENDVIEEILVAKNLISSLKNIPTGTKHASEYHNLMIGILEFIFFPHLIRPIKEREIHNGRKRIDIVMENGARDGIFYRIHRVRHLPSSFIMFECKNYSTDVANPELDQISSRFSTNRGKLGFLCCRNFQDRGLFVQRCQDTFKDDRGLVVPLDDATIILLLDLIANEKRKEIDLKISDLINEIWIN
jgi:hypothetical protein